MNGRTAILTVVALLAATTGTASAKAYPLASLQRRAYSVNITGFEIDGKEVPYSGTPCNSPNVPTSCPKVQAGEGAVQITYGPLASAPLPSGALVSIFACYSNVSSFNRPWRANGTATNVLTDKACHFKIKANVSAEAGGTATFKPNEESPTSTLIIRAYVYSQPNVPYGYANAPQGFFGIERLPTPSHAVRSASIGMCFAGPVILAIALPLDSYLTKRRKRQS
ncbi:hypothetical protein WJX73_009547 [Symbiochloris irregularis]|uniref:Uncharacterized protein n=1 Tax=Symbiochloris irregularis TaxID=706552 RepID=A0AAW1NYI2_9CHLO